MRSSTTTLLWACAFAAAICSAAPAAAHPHVWVTVETTVVYDKGTVTGLRHAWTFDEMYTAMAIQGLDTNNDGNYDKDELAELAKVNMEGLKEFDYFTFAKLGDGPLKLMAPADAWLEYKDSILTLHFTVTLDKPVLAEAEGFSFQVYDPSFFIAFDLAKDDPVKLGEAAPQGCKTHIGVPETQSADAQRLGEAFFSQLGGDSNYGVTQAKTISVTCAKS